MKQQNRKTAVIYARYSSHNQREESIEQQVDECKAYAAANNLEIVDIYADSACTGKNDKRAQYKRLQRDAQREKFDCIIAYKSNRIARNMLMALNFENAMAELGIKVLYAKEEFGDTAAGRFALRTMMNVNQFYVENMAEDIKRGMKDNAEACKVVGPLPLGYKRGEDDRPVIDEPYASIVREIFTRIASGETFAAIANDLNMRGVKTKTGGFWQKNSFHRIVNNERYTGVYIYMDVRKEGGMPQIIDKEMYLRVQKVLHTKKNPQGRHRENGDYLLTGKLKCGHCGAYMMGMSGTSKSGQLHHYYACQEARKGKCHKKNVRRDYIERQVALAIHQHVLQDEVIEWIADCTIKYQSKLLAESELGMLEAQLADANKAISNIMAAIEQGIFTSTTKQRLLDLEAEQKTLSNKITITKSELTPVEREQVIAWLESMKDGNIENKAYQKMLFDTFVTAVFLYDDGRCKVVFDIGGNSKDVDLNFITGDGGEDKADVRFSTPNPHQKQKTAIRRSFVFAVAARLRTPLKCRLRHLKSFAPAA